MGNEINMRTVATALRMAVTAILWVFAERDIKKHSFADIVTPERHSIPGVLPQTSAHIFFHPDCYCRYRNHTGSTLARSRTEGLWPITAGGDLHPALKMNDSVVVSIIRICGKNARIIFFTK